MSDEEIAGLGLEASATELKRERFESPCRLVLGGIDMECSSSEPPLRRMIAWLQVLGLANLLTP